MSDETGSVCELKEKIKTQNILDWVEEVDSTSSLSWYRMAKDNGAERYARLLQGQGMRFMFRVRTGLAGLLQDKKVCRMCSDGSCVVMTGVWCAATVKWKAWATSLSVLREDGKHDWMSWAKLRGLPSGWRSLSL